MSTKTTPRPVPGLGRGLFALTDIAVGENVLDIPIPFVAVLNTDRLEDTCSGCFGQRQLEDEKITLKACTGCQVVKYCDKTCQGKDWKFAHALECSIFRNLQPRVLPINARAMLRMVLRHGRGKYSSEELDQFLQLETHIKDVREKNAPQWERISLTSKAVKAYSGTDMSEEVISAFGAKLEINAFNLTNAIYDRIGAYCHPYAALINHSCAYNSIASFDGPTLVIKALRPIPKDSQIFISYIDATNPYPRRQSELQDRYFFTCRCPNCEKEATAPPPLSVAQEKAYNILSSISSIPPTEATHSLCSAITLLKTSGEPLTTQPSITLRDELISTLLLRGKFKSAFAHAAVRYRHTDPVVYPSATHPLRQVHAWTLAKLAIHLSTGIEPHGTNTTTSDGEGEEEIALEQFEVDFGLIVWSVLKGLVSVEETGATGPGFKRMVRKAFGEVHGEFLAGGLDPRGLGEKIKVEWGKVDRLVGAVVGK
ncbi:S-adenosylmethionine-dependent methyltransferase [Aspergillus ibericus CBS 121593]|uniref:SET and MYND domain protein n=1 Tax=Aspergillus ibericus CBS 121593 TaxID=1448316 RepID=A0A395H6Y5_9EURO|nr:SET and MYND domain protein [Aspergillus ibericus CBS 121593]RAL03410.1 SET and MYND domain protein [Aspergillus ibericus CBS 121593]